MIYALPDHFAKGYFSLKLGWIIWQFVNNGVKSIIHFLIKFPVDKGRVNLIQSGFFGHGKSKMKARFEPVTSGFASHCLAH